MLTAVSSSSPGKALVERFDIHQLVREFEVARVDLIIRQGMKHEGIIGIGAVSHANQLLGGGQIVLLVVIAANGHAWCAARRARPVQRALYRWCGKHLRGQ